MSVESKLYKISEYTVWSPGKLFYVAGDREVFKLVVRKPELWENTEKTILIKKLLK